jgi:hypothetical protein
MRNRKGRQGSVFCGALDVDAEQAKPVFNPKGINILDHE